MAKVRYYYKYVMQLFCDVLFKKIIKTYLS